MTEKAHAQCQHVKEARMEAETTVDELGPSELPLAARRILRAAVIGRAPVALTATTVATAAVDAHGVNRRMDRREDRRDRRR
jgi:hypothetical protein